MMRALKYAVITGALWAVAYLGLTRGLPWAFNVLEFIVITTAFVLTFVIIGASDRELKQLTSNYSPPAPPWFDGMQDVAMCLYLAAFGHFWLAGFWLWQAMCSQYLYSLCKRNQQKKDSDTLEA